MKTIAESMQASRLFCILPNSTVIVSAAVTESCLLLDSCISSFHLPHQLLQQQQQQQSKCSLSVAARWPGGCRGAVVKILVRQESGFCPLPHDFSSPSSIIYNNISNNSTWYCQVIASRYNIFFALQSLWNWRFFCANCLFVSLHDLQPYIVMYWCTLLCHAHS